MKKIIYSLFIVACSGTAVYGQYLTQSADGKGTFLFRGANISLDVAKADLSFTINNMNNTVQPADEKDNHRFLYGGSMSAKSEEGIGNLFSSGDFVPAANLNGYFGIRLANSYNQPDEEIRNRLDKNLQILSKSQLAAFTINMDAIIDRRVQNSSLTDAALKIRISTDWKQEVKKGKVNELTSYLKGYIPKNQLDANSIIISGIITDLLQDIKTLKEADDIEVDKIKNSLIKYWTGFVNSRLWKLSIFTFGGINSSSFKRVDSIHTTNLSKTFIKENFRGGNWGVGINYQLNSWKFGVTYAYTKTNNFSQLDKSDYKLTTNYNANNQVLSQEKTVTAYTGNYGEVEMNELNGDVLYTFGLDADDGTYAMLNAYVRGNFFSRNKDLIPSNYDIGIGTYFFAKNSKFLGGLYVELQDVDNALEKNKPIADQNIQPALKRLTFGIIAKFSLNSLMSWQ